ncbi:hypothetical protein HKD37_01G001114 [Glycine soja]
MDSNSSRLGFPALITALCVARGVISDSLTFESLSLAINLAYIKKNCWNLDDPLITFPGSRKARARGFEGPSSFAPPASTPAPSTSTPPSVAPAPVSTPAGTSAQSSDLTSLHHGLCLVMQSIHNLAQHWPIINMKEFTAQVAWPGVQPSPLGGEVTLEVTPRTSPVTTPLVEVSDEEDGTVDTDYAADMAAAQSTWDPWPATAQETSQPAQDTPSSPQDKPAPAQEEP